MVRLLRERTAFEANLFDENNGFLVPASVFPYFYALIGERNPRQAPKAGSRSPYSALACDAFELISRAGPISKQKMQEVLGGSVSLAALDGALGELWSKLRITRVDYRASEGSVWDVLYRWAPDAVKRGHRIVGAGSADRIALKICRLRDRDRTGRPRNLLWKFRPAFESEGRRECPAGRPRNKLRARQRTIDVADHARESRGGSRP